MKKTYCELDISIVKFENEDIVTSSSLMDFTDGLNLDNSILFDDLFSSSGE